MDLIRSFSCISHFFYFNDFNKDFFNIYLPKIKIIIIFIVKIISIIYLRRGNRVYRTRTDVNNKIPIHV